MKLTPTPRVTVDPVVFMFTDNALKVLLVKRTNDPEKGAWALPGGHVRQGERLLSAIEQSLHDKASVNIGSMGYIDQLYAFDTVGLDPRGHAITIAFLCLSKRATIKQPNSPSKPAFLDVNKLPELAFDHITIVEKARKQLKELSLKTTIASTLLPDVFTLSTLHSYYETVLGKTLDRRNLRKKILKLNVLEKTGKQEQGVPNRPGDLYKFKTTNVSDLQSSIE